MKALTKIQKLQKELNEILIERESQIEGALAALISGSHVLLLGPPGTAKSMLTNLLCQAIDKAKYFQWLMTKFTVPEELFGPHSIKAIEQGKYERITTNKLPEANVAFLDEVWKPNSAILNACLKVLNEHKFENGQTIMDVPLVSCFGASNELPKGEELGAMNDRFLLRYWVDYVQDRAKMQNLMKAVATRAKKQTVTNKISLDDLQELRAESTKITLSDEVVQALDTLQTTLQNAGIKVSDRRILDCIPLLQAFALLRGENEVSSDDLELLADMFWHRPEQRREIMQLVSPYANPLNLKAIEFEDAAVEAFKNWQATREDMNQCIQTNRILKDILKSMDEELKDRPASKTRKLRAAREKVESMQKEVLKMLL